jgi:putative ABC transport system permease protein
MAHHPFRAAFAALGMSLATGILVVSLFLGESMEGLIDVTYFLSDRQNATISFVDKRPESVVMQVGRLPGVVAAESYREMPVRIRKGNVERRITISARPQHADLNRVIDTDLRPVVLPEVGLAVSAILAKLLGVRTGDMVEVDLLEGARRTVALPVSALVEDYFGLRGMMDAQALSRLLREAPTVTGVKVSLDTGSRAASMRRSRASRLSAACHCSARRCRTSAMQSHCW